MAPVVQSCCLIWCRLVRSRDNQRPKQCFRMFFGQMARLVSLCLCPVCVGSRNPWKAIRNDCGRSDVFRAQARLISARPGLIDGSRRMGTPAAPLPRSNAVDGERESHAYPMEFAGVRTPRLRIGHGFDPSTDWIGLCAMTVATFLITYRCSTVDAVSFKLWFMNF